MFTALQFLIYIFQHIKKKKNLSIFLWPFTLLISLQRSQSSLDQCVQWMYLTLKDTPWERQDEGFLENRFLWTLFAQHWAFQTEPPLLLHTNPTSLYWDLQIPTPDMALTQTSKYKYNYITEGACCNRTQV